ncbi:MAG: response regulator [Proteobacteria bacterium]|nr:response regulator [Pseudomonadota bacterium]MBU1714732.1 response regulator [Pseudomonadota bacterium]
MKNILITDDEESIRITLLEWFATKYDFNILMAENGKEAVKILKSETVDLLISDLNMPKMDGFELLAFMNNNFPSIPIVIMTAFVTPEIKQKVKDLGAAQFLEKPLNFETLEAINFEKISGSSSGQVMGISLQSFLQLIDMEHKTCTLTVKSKGKTGYIYLDKGELINAVTGDLEGPDAAYEIVCWTDEDLKIEIDKTCKNQERKIEFTIMSLLMESARMIDEINQKKSELNVDEDGEVKKDTAPTPEPPTEPPPPPVEKAVIQNNTPVATAELGSGTELDLGEIQNKLKEFANIDGFAGASLTTPAGEPLYMFSASGSDLDLESISISCNNILLNTQKASVDMGAGKSRLIHIETEQKHILIRCLNKGSDPIKTEPGKAHFHLVLILSNANSLGMAKIMTGKIMETLAGKR